MATSSNPLQALLDLAASQGVEAPTYRRRFPDTPSGKKVHGYIDPRNPAGAIAADFYSHPNAEATVEALRGILARALGPAEGPGRIPLPDANPDGVAAIRGILDQLGELSKWDNVRRGTAPPPGLTSEQARVFHDILALETGGYRTNRPTPDFQGPMPADAPSHIEGGAFRYSTPFDQENRMVSEGRDRSDIERSLKSTGSQFGTRKFSHQERRAPYSFQYQGEPTIEKQGYGPAWNLVERPGELQTHVVAPDVADFRPESLQQIADFIKNDPVINARLQERFARSTPNPGGSPQPAPDLLDPRSVRNAYSAGERSPIHREATPRQGTFGYLAPSMEEPGPSQLAQIAERLRTRQAIEAGSPLQGFEANQLVAPADPSRGQPTVLQGDVDRLEHMLRESGLPDELVPSPITRGVNHLGRGEFVREDPHLQGIPDASSAAWAADPRSDMDGGSTFDRGNETVNRDRSLADWEQAQLRDAEAGALNTRARTASMMRAVPGHKPSPESALAALVSQLEDPRPRVDVRQLRNEGALKDVSRDNLHDTIEGLGKYRQTHYKAQGELMDAGAPLGDAPPRKALAKGEDAKRHRERESLSMSDRDRNRQASRERERAAGTFKFSKDRTNRRDASRGELEAKSIGKATRINTRAAKSIDRRVDAADSIEEIKGLARELLNRAPGSPRGHGGTVMNSEAFALEKRLVEKADLVKDGAGEAIRRLLRAFVKGRH